MINKKQRTKDVFYNDRIYIVPYTSLKHIDGIDVVQISEMDIVIWDNYIKKWIKASNDLIEKYKKANYDKITGYWII